METESIPLFMNSRDSVFLLILLLLLGTVLAILQLDASEVSSDFLQNREDIDNFNKTPLHS